MPKVIELEEYVRRSYPPTELSVAMGEALWRGYGTQVAVEFPCPKTDGQWQLTAQGWVGYIPLTPDLAFLLQPKVPLGNIFRMLEYAYRLKSFRFLEGLVDCQSLAEFYERLANILARRVLDRGRKGFYRTYLPEVEQLPYVRGRLDVRQVVQAPWDVRVRCHYEEHTADVEENQLLAWTLWRITRSGMCTERVLPGVRRAFHALRGFVTLQAFPSAACVGRLYNRLNDDYQPMHALCRFFLEHTGPSHEMGDHTTLPFLVGMARLYELFVAEWLKAHLPAALTLRAQERVNIDPAKGLHFTVDLVLYDAQTGAPCCVLDTKYKAVDQPGSDELAQVIAYAEAKGCREAILIYPKPLAGPLDIVVGGIHVRNLTFALDGDLEAAGARFRAQLVVSGQ